MALKILIVGGGVFNKGGEAMLWTVVSELTSRLPDVSFYIGNQRVRQFNADDVIAAGIPQIEPGPSALWPRLLALFQAVISLPVNPRYWRSGYKDIFYQHALVGSVDAIVDISGFLYVDKRGASGAFRLGPLAQMAESRGVPYIYLPQTWGPFSNWRLRLVVKKALRSSRLFYARDTLSHGYLCELLGRPPQAVEQSPDIAFLFQGAKASADILERLSFRAGQPTVGVAPNMRVYERSQVKDGENLYLTALTQTVSLFAKRGVQVLLLPHEFRSDCADDRVLCEKIETAVGSDNVVRVKDELTAKDLKGLVGLCEMVIGSRFHSLVAALSQGIPVVAVGWAHKYPELLREFGLESYVYDYNSVSGSDFANVVSEAWDARESLKDRVTAGLPFVNQRLDTVFDDVAQAILSASQSKLGHSSSRL